MFSKKKITALALLLTTLSISSLASAEEELIGSNEYRVSCASCHGIGGKGDGQMAKFLTVKPSNLTMLAKNAGNSVYPFLKVFQVIDGRTEVSGHGDRAMPVWGDRYNKEAIKKYGSFGGETATRARVLELVYYLQSIQEK
ncbi:cytochrome c [uncultured Cocleimonas sp.]|uniref:c-type cytochrome n=1 Tax=uncultured Cocleimonas sp. TaxID=1051587 RepID=UPI00260C1831|nr:cytochrome c [uncultured Cocleimonas sp.]